MITLLNVVTIVFIFIKIFCLKTCRYVSPLYNIRVLREKSYLKLKANKSFGDSYKEKFVLKLCINAVFCIIQKASNTVINVSLENIYAWENSSSNFCNVLLNTQIDFKIMHVRIHISMFRLITLSI